MENEDPINLWQHVHGAITHFPIALVFAALAFDLGALIFKKASWRTVGFWLLITAVIALLPAIGSGLYYVYLNPAGKNTLAQGGYVMKTLLDHRNAALWGGGILLIPTFLRIRKRDDLSTGLYILCIVCVLVAAALIGFTGFKGAYVQRGY